MSLKQRLNDDMKAALKAGDKRRLAVIRLAHAAIRQREVDERIELDDTQVLATLEKMQKQRRDSVTQYREGGREDLAEQEEFELAVLQDYLPTPLSEAEIEALVDRAIADSGASNPREMGKVIGLLRPQMAGRADMAAVSALIRRKLGG